MTKARLKRRGQTGVICDKKVPTKLKLMIYSDSTDFALRMRKMANVSKDVKCMATKEMRMVQWALGISLLECQRNEEILEEARVKQMVMRRLQWFKPVKRKDETENMRAIVKMKMEGQRPRRRSRLRWKDTARTDQETWKIKEDWATDGEKRKGLCPTQGDGGEMIEIKQLESSSGLNTSADKHVH